MFVTCQSSNGQIKTYEGHSTKVITSVQYILALLAIEGNVGIWPVSILEV